MRLRKVLRALSWLGVAVALLAVTSAWALDRFFGTNVTLLAPNASDVIELNRELWSPGDPVADIYGISSHKVRVVFADDSRIIHPKEDASLALYTVDKQAGENPLQAKTLWFFAKYLVIAGLAAALLLRLLHFLLMRRARTQPHVPAVG